MNISTQASTSVTISPNQPVVHVGLDVHKNSNFLAARLSGQTGWLAERTFGTQDLSKLHKFLKKLEQHGRLACCYEASGFGYALYRRLMSWDIGCTVIAPSLIPTKPGDRRKTDRLDARNVCDYFQAGLLTKVHVPDAEQESVRGLVRCRRTMREDVTRSKQQLTKFLQTKGLVFRAGKTPWTNLHFQWLNRLEFDCPADTATFQVYLSTLDCRLNRLKEIDKMVALILLGRTHSKSLERGPPEMS